MSMSQTTRRPALRDLEALALTQGGYFDRQDALARGIRDDLLHHHVSTGRFERVLPGVYRLASAPLSPRDDLLLAWVWSNYRGAISHESALALYGLGDLMPMRVQLIVPPDFRRSSGPFDLHWSELPEEDVALYEGVRVTTPTRSIVDAAAAGADPEQVQKAVIQALARALTTPDGLRAAAGRPRYRNRRTVQPLIEAAIQHATS
jgi:predicted transcriptional regulator of viral defense system